MEDEVETEIMYGVCSLLFSAPRLLETRILEWS